MTVDASLPRVLLLVSSPLAAQLDALFGQFAQTIGPEAFAQLEADLQTNAEAWRQAGVDSLHQALQEAHDEPQS